MGSYLSDPYTPDGEPDAQEAGQDRLGDLLSGRLGDITLDSVEAVRDVREPR